MKYSRNLQQGSAHAMTAVGLTLAVAGLVGFIYWNNIVMPYNKAKSAAAADQAKKNDDTQAKTVRVNAEITQTGSMSTMDDETIGWSLKEGEQTDIRDILVTMMNFDDNQVTIALASKKSDKILQDSRTATVAFGEKYVYFVRGTGANGPVYTYALTFSKS